MTDYLKNKTPEEIELLSAKIAATLTLFGIGWLIVSAILYVLGHSPGTTIIVAGLHFLLVAPTMVLDEYADRKRYRA